MDAPELSTERRTITQVYERYWNVRYDINSGILKYRYVLFRQIWFGISTPFKIAFTFYFIAGESEC